MFEMHRKYLFSKINVFIILIICIIQIIAIMFLTSFSDDNCIRWLERKANIENINNDLFFICKFVTTILAIYIMGSAFLINNDNYGVIIIKNRKERINYFITKVLAILMILFIISFIECIISMIIISLNYNFLSDYESLITTFILFYFNGITYGLFAIIFVLLFKNYFAILIPIILFIILEVITKTKITEYIYLFLPNQTIYNVISIENYWPEILKMILVSIFYSMIACFVYYELDLCSK